MKTLGRGNFIKSDGLDIFSSQPRLVCPCHSQSEGSICTSDQSEARAGIEVRHWFALDLVIAG